MIKDITLITSVILAAAVFILPRRYFLVPYILAACLIPSDQRLLLMNLDFTPIRILIAAGVLRMFLRAEIGPIRINLFDKIFIAWLICRSITYILLWQDFNAVINRCGMLYDAAGLYWLFRQNIRCWNDVRQTAMLFAFAAVISAPLIAFEWITGHNPFAELGRVNTEIRHGEYRCQGAFPHAIMLGIFWATLAPVFVGFAAIEMRKYLYWTAAAASVFAVIASTSSTPAAVLVVIIAMLSLFFYRQYGRWIVLSIVIMAVMLHFVMKKPVWHLVARANITSGSTGWHRFHLIDQAIKNFDQWAFIGTKSTAEWGWGLEDVTNEYVLEGVRGGAISLIFLIIILVMALRAFTIYSMKNMPRKFQWWAWCLAAAMLGHCLSFIGVSYFGQIMMLFYLMLAVASLMFEFNYRADTSCVKTEGERKHGYVHSYS